MARRRKKRVHHKKRKHHSKRRHHSKRKKRGSRKGRMPAGLRRYWAEVRAGKRAKPRRRRKHRR